MMQYPFELRIGIDEEVLDPEDYTSSDACGDLMEEFFKRSGIPVPDAFICLSVRSAEKLTKLRTAGRGDSSLATLYGRQYALRPEYLDKVEIVCSGDCLKLMEAAVCAYIRDGTPLQDGAKKITVLHGLSVEERAKAIWEAHQSKGLNAQYAEARIYAPFNSEWFVECDMDSANGNEDDGYEVTF
jgi:hypothetical protein